MTRVVIVGGSGTFGQRIAERLAQTPFAQLIIAGRHIERCEQTASFLRSRFACDVETATINSVTVTPETLAALCPSIVINASGPFQDHNYALAEAAIGCKSHYIDLADARQFVTDIVTLDSAATQAGVLVVSGASSVPGVSSTVVRHLARDLKRIESVSIAIAPGNHFDPGEATTRSVLQGIGKPITGYRDGKPNTIYGWQDLTRKNFASLGKRWLCNVDVPDLSLIPARIPNIKTVTFQAGQELAIQHFGLWILSFLSRAGLLRHPDRLAKPLLRLKRLTKPFGGDRGGMRVEVVGQNANDKRVKCTWVLVAAQRQGPYLPTVASTILTRLLAEGQMSLTGAMPCFGLFSYQDFCDEIKDLAITCTIDQVMA